MPAPYPVSLHCVPTPVAEQAVGDVLTLNRPEESTGVKVEVSRWPFMTENQLATLHACGQNTDGTALMLCVADAEPINRQEYEAGWHRTIEWSYLQNLKHNSHLVFVFQVALNSTGCDCPLLFPPLCLQVQVPYLDLTTFCEGQTAPWNGWERGAAAQDVRDLVVGRSENEFVLFNMTYTNSSAGPILQKVFEDLEAGQRYKFGLLACRVNTNSNVPSLSLAVGTTTVAGPQSFTTTTWELFEGTFTAGYSPETLSVDSHTASGQGNDYAISRIWVKSE
ncbi:sugar-binding protein [Pseudomonas sp. HS6]|uniref:sugar-binding protein n=1 Tax=Pseudomonas sp. HS6 TaxID=2850559 RepID=UPI002018DA87|nr:sugar-binding protein [Pseudomonas sp. HS6]UQS13161.1 sugar-binding protein [Pseudomonas sp. HS6]